MSAEQPYLGSRISLISKSEIRYEGVLYTIDTIECTVALAKVRSFGTEDRVTERPVAPRDEVYEYIIFRGSDIKDIRVCDPPKPQPPPPPIGLPNDPAILQHSMAMPSSSAGFSMGFKQSLGPIGGMAYQPYSQGQMMPQVQPFTAPPAIPQPTPAPHSASASESAGSRTTTPTKRKSPTMDQGTQVSGVSAGRDARRSEPRTTQRSAGGQMTGGRGRAGQTGFGGQRQQQQSQQQQQQQQYSYGPPGAGRGRGRGRGASVGGVGGEITGQQGQQTGAPPRGGASRGAGRGRSRSSSTLNFPSEYDFEQANAEFQELENQFAKAKINDKRDDSGNETAAGDNEQEEDPVFYDKAKSFFDSISCEAIERSRGAFKRPDWRQERKLNVETFGVETNYRRRGFRGGFRGSRGGYYGRGGGGRYRGRGGQQIGGFQRSGSQTKEVGTPGRTSKGEVTVEAGNAASYPVNKSDNWS